MHAGYAFAEFYLSLIAYFILHMIFVISSDFVEAFNIPPLNIGIYVDKLAAIRALLMVIADILEWGITQKACGDPGQTALSEAAKGDLKNLSRRLGSLISFLAMLICRLAYIIIVYKSDNKSLSVFITLCIEGFWFGVFQMSFFAVGPEFNAITSLGIHTMGNFIFFLQVILQRRAKKKPKINCLYRVRVHACIVVITSLIALGLWIWFCYEYSYGGSDPTKFNELVEEMQAVSVTSSSSQINDIANALSKAFQEGGTKFKDLVEQLKSKSGFNSSTEDLDKGKLKDALNTVKTQIKDLLKTEFDVTVGNADSQIDVENPVSTNKVTVKVKKSDGTSPNDDNKGSSIVKQNIDKKIPQNIPIEVLVHEDLVSVSDSTEKKEKAKKIAQKLAKRLSKAAEKAKIAGSTGTYNPGQELVKEEFSITQNVKVEASDNTVTVKISGTDTKDSKGSANVKVKKGLSEQANITIEVKDDGNVISKFRARKIARKLGQALASVQSVKDNQNSPIQITARIDHFGNEHVWSPFLLFIIGAFAEDFAVPGVLPFAFLDPEKANLVNYLTPLFFMTGAFIVFLVDSVFSAEESLFGSLMNTFDSEFKSWSEGEAWEWNFVWTLNIPKYIAFFIAMWSIHGTYDSLRCIIQSRWRVLILTMVVVVPRATLEVMGYVGVANYAIAASQTFDFEGFTYIAFHDMIAMFCRFVYVKFAVGYK